METLATDVAGTIAPGLGEASNWKTSVHMPELNIGPVLENKKTQYIFNVIQGTKIGQQVLYFGIKEKYFAQA